MELAKTSPGATNHSPPMDSSAAITPTRFLCRTEFDLPLALANSEATTKQLSEVFQIIE